MRANCNSKIASLVLLFTLVFNLCSAFADDAPERLNNDSIVELKEIGLSEQVIIEKIKSSTPQFDLTIPGLKKLKEKGVSDGVIAAMLASTRERPPAQSSPVPPQSIQQQPRKEIPEYQSRFQRAVEAGYKGNLSQSAFWTTKAEIQSVASSVRSIIATTDPKWQVAGETSSVKDSLSIALAGKGFLSTPRRGLVQLTKIDEVTDVRVVFRFEDDPMRSAEREFELRNYMPKVLANFRKALEDSTGFPLTGRIQNMTAPTLRPDEQLVADIKRNAKYGDVVTVRIEQAVFTYKNERLPIRPFDVDVVKGESVQVFFRTEDKIHGQYIQLDMDKMARSIHLQGFDECVNSNWETPQALWIQGERYVLKKRHEPNYPVADVVLFVRFKQI